MENPCDQRQQELVNEFSALSGWEDRYKKIIAIGKELPRLPDELYHEKYLVKGCQSQVWMFAQKDEQGKMDILGDSDAMIVKGLVALLLRVYSGASPQDILASPPWFVEKLGFTDYLSPSRANGFLSMIKQIKLYAQALSVL